MYTRIFPAEQTAIQLGFHRVSVDFPGHPKSTQANRQHRERFRSRNIMYDNKVGTNKFYVLADDDRASIADKLTYYLDAHVEGSALIKRVCPMVPYTKVPGCA